MTTERFEPEFAPDGSLSPAGVARRAAMLAELDAAMRRRNFLRTIVRSGAAAVPLIVLGALLRGYGLSNKNVPATIANTPPSEAPAVRGFIQLVQTDPFITRRLAAAGHIADIKLINDAELQACLRSLGRPSGLVRIGGRTLLANEIVPRPGEPDQKPIEPGLGTSS